MLVGFGVGSPLGVEPFWVSGAAAVVLVVWARRRGLLDRAATRSRAAHPAFALFVLCLGVVVAALATGFLGDWVSDLLPDGTGFASLLLIAVLATVLANLLTNLLGDAAARPAAGTAGRHRGARGAARPQHRLRAELHRLAGQPAVAPRHGPARAPAVAAGVPPGLAAGARRSACWPQLRHFRWSPDRICGMIAA